MQHRHTQEKNGMLHDMQQSWAVYENEQVNQEKQISSNLDDISSKEDEAQDHSLTGEILTESQIGKLSLKTEGQGQELSVQNSGTGLSLEEDATLSNSKETYLLWLKDDEGRKELQNEILDTWITPKYLADKLKDWIDNAVAIWNDWTIIPDHRARLMYIKEAEKLLWYTKKDPVTIHFVPITNPQNPI